MTDWTKDPLPSTNFVRGSIPSSGWKRHSVYEDLWLSERVGVLDQVSVESESRNRFKDLHDLAHIQESLLKIVPNRISEQLFALDNIELETDVLFLREQLKVLDSIEKDEELRNREKDVYDFVLVEEAARVTKTLRLVEDILLLDFIERDAIDRNVNKDVYDLVRLDEQIRLLKRLRFYLFESIQLLDSIERDAVDRNVNKDLHDLIHLDEQLRLLKRLRFSLVESIQLLDSVERDAEDRNVNKNIYDLVRLDEKLGLLKKTVKLLEQTYILDSIERDAEDRNINKNVYDLIHLDETITLTKTDLYPPVITSIQAVKTATLRARCLFSVNAFTESVHVKVWVNDNPEPFVDVDTEPSGSYETIEFEGSDGDAVRFSAIPYKEDLLGGTEGEEAFSNTVHLGEGG